MPPPPPPPIQSTSAAAPFADRHSLSLSLSPTTTAHTLPHAHLKEWGPKKMSTYSFPPPFRQYLFSSMKQVHWTLGSFLLFPPRPR